jgi:hypothetical protein
LKVFFGGASSDDTADDGPALDITKKTGTRDDIPAKRRRLFIKICADGIAG